MPTVVLVDVLIGRSTFRIERDCRTGRQTYRVDGREVPARQYLAAIATAVACRDDQRGTAIRGPWR